MAGLMLSKGEVEKRVDACFKMRDRDKHAITQEQWVEYCHHNFGDKSEQQYCAYWANAKKKYDEGWKERLNKLLGPAVDELNGMLASEDEKIRQRAIDQIMKYTGNDIQKIQAEIKGEIKVTFGDEG